MCQITSVDLILPMRQLVKDMSVRKSAHHQKNHPSHHNIIMYILLTVLHSMPGSDRENLFKNQELLQLVIVSFILMTLMYDLEVILKGEIRCQAFLGVKGLINITQNDRSIKNALSFFLFTSKLIRFWILHSNWVRLNLFIYASLWLVYLER